MTEPTNDLDENIREGDSIVRPLPQDNGTPFGPPDEETTASTQPATGPTNPNHQATDSATDIDSQELYDAGLQTASNTEEPNQDNTVVGYDPEADQRRQ